MGYLKMLGLAAVAAMALTAFLGAGSASATVLCTTTATPCGPGWHIDSVVFTIKAETTGTASSTEGLLESTCANSTMTATISVTGSSATTPVLTVPRNSLTWSSCVQTTDTLEGGDLEVHSISGSDNGTVTLKGFDVTIILAGVSCSFGAGKGIDFGTLTGGANAVLDAEAVVPKTSGSFLCPSETVWKAQYEVTNHTQVYAESE